MLVVVVIVGSILKWSMKKKREELDGFHGIVKEESYDMDEDISDDWKPL
jgi:hypothetical protein